MATIEQVTAVIPTIRKFVSRSQISTLANGCRGEEADWFKTRLIELADQFNTMPKTYEQDGKGDDAVAHLHYFNGNMDWYITERDMEDEQLQAFGLASLGFDTPELGYISILELIENRVELDLHFTPTTIGELKKRYA